MLERDVLLLGTIQRRVDCCCVCLSVSLLKAFVAVGHEFDAAPVVSLLSSHGRLPGAGVLGPEGHGCLGGGNVDVESRSTRTVAPSSSSSTLFDDGLTNSAGGDETGEDGDDEDGHR